jgi:pantoate--beta-alanine ligase
MKEVLAMQVVETVREMQELCRGRRVGLVPTMGALHEGHISLVRRAREENEFVAATIFVNPLQFGPNEDLGKYPRTFEEDCRQLEEEGVDLVFAPSVEEMYPAGAATTVTVAGVGDRLGVATVVAKLFHIAAPGRAYFGQKDAAQVAVLHAMVRDLNFDLELVVCPIVRDADGLALSSRNRYLSDEERVRALGLRRALAAVEEAYGRGVVDAAGLRDVGMKELVAVKVDYLEMVNGGTLEAVDRVGPGTLVAVAAWVGTTRLIDNWLVG